MEDDKKSNKRLPKNLKWKTTKKIKMEDDQIKKREDDKKNSKWKK